MDGWKERRRENELNIFAKSIRIERMSLYKLIHLHWHLNEPNNKQTEPQTPHSKFALELDKDTNANEMTATNSETVKLYVDVDLIEHETSCPSMNLLTDECSCRASRNTTINRTPNP